MPLVARGSRCWRVVDEIMLCFVVFLLLLLFSLSLSFSFFLSQSLPPLFILNKPLPCSLTHLLTHSLLIIFYLKPQPWGNVQYTCQHDRREIAEATKRDWTVVGEWSNAIGMSTPTSLSGKSWLRAFTWSQLDAYCPACVGLTSNPGKGAFFWNFKIERGYDEWNYMLGLTQGWAVNFTDMRSMYDFSCSASYDG